MTLLEAPSVASELAASQDGWRTVIAEAGIVHEEVDAKIIILQPLDERGAAGGIAQIGTVGEDPQAGMQALQLGLERVQAVQPTGGQDEGPRVGGQLPSKLRPQPRGGPRDLCCASLVEFHREQFR